VGRYAIGSKVWDAVNGFPRASSNVIELLGATVILQWTKQRYGINKNQTQLQANF